MKEIESAGQIDPLAVTASKQTMELFAGFAVPMPELGYARK
jgi:hypothetical protein